EPRTVTPPGLVAIRGPRCSSPATSLLGRTDAASKTASWAQKTLDTKGNARRVIRHWTPLAQLRSGYAFECAVTISRAEPCDASDQRRRGSTRYTSTIVPSARGTALRIASEPARGHPDGF